VNAVRDRRPPQFDDAAQAAVHAFCVANLESRALSDDSFERVVAAVGREGVIELIGLMSHYCAVSFTLNSYGVPPKDGAAPELKD
jgi:4-carboxymuconolactone decarboxylase